MKNRKYGEYAEYTGFKNSYKRLSLVINTIIYCKFALKIFKLIIFFLKKDIY